MQEKRAGGENPRAVTGFADTVLARLLKPVIATLIASAALAATSVAAAEAPPRQSLIFEGAGGRTPLTQWTLRRDPPDAGLAKGWARGGFSGATVSVPNVVNATPYSGKAGGRNYMGSVAWYRTTFQAPTAGRYELDFRSANYKAEVFLDGKRLGTHHGSYLPFGLQAVLTPGAHTIVVRVDWRFPQRQAEEGFHRTWFNWGGLDGEVDVRQIGASDLLAPAVSTTLSGAQADVKVSVQVRNYGAARTVKPEGSLVRPGQTIALSFPAVALAANATATVSATATIAQPALWSPLSPNLYELELAVPGESSYAARVGLRQVTWHGQELFLDGQRLKLHGATIQEDVAGARGRVDPR